MTYRNTKQHFASTIMNPLLLTCAIIIFSNRAQSGMKKSCENIRKQIKHDFYPLRHCQRSNKTVIAFDDSETVEECAEFARKSKGLAFNFSPSGRRQQNLFIITNEGNKTRDNKEEFHNCQVLSCPEHKNFSTVINDTRFDYYTLYAYPAPIENSTCLPSLGMFMLHTKASNYSTAYQTCRSHNGQLANIATERRTIEISNFLKRFALKATTTELAAFVGLNESATRGKFSTSNGESLECFDYRAWSLGHPAEIRKQPACVVLTRGASWKIQSCNKRAVFVCELFTSGPNPFVKNLGKECSAKLPNNRFMPKKVTNLDA